MKKTIVFRSNLKSQKTLLDFMASSLIVLIALIVMTARRLDNLSTVTVLDKTNLPTERLGSQEARAKWNEFIIHPSTVRILHPSMDQISLSK